MFCSFLSSVSTTRDESAIGAAQVVAGCSDYLLLDSHDPATGVVGATGLSHDWSVSTLIPPAVDVPVILAGGLTPENVAARIAEYARPGEVLVSQEMVEASNGDALVFREIGPVELKGVGGTVRLHAASRAV